MKCSVEVAAGVFARFSCRHSWNLRLRLTEPDNHRPANTIDVLRPKLSMLSWHSSIATSVMAVTMSMQRPCKLILNEVEGIALPYRGPTTENTIRNSKLVTTHCKNARKFLKAIVCIHAKKKHH